ncbi:Aconitate isomerase [Methylobacterium crusticola]|uniref:Aconitate isomerase n=1 Tax=Methylobacterium crusticola TaxID=1697972 RepID=A0ABQ4QY94_9HYPH|nr:substrate-binding domain-containing protein [Methylobacterium crusticola]GJD50147.1 Aconitate isomerase [Methylobacterium crusticola]
MAARIAPVALGLTLLAATAGRAAEIRVMSGGAPREALAALVPEFERRTGHRVRLTFAVVTALAQRLGAGEETDAVLLPVPVIDRLVEAGPLRAEGRAVLGALSLSLIVRRGAPAPDIATPDALRRALTGARSVVLATPDATPSGAHMARVLEQLGIAAAMRDKVIHKPALDGGVDLVASGGAEIGVYPTSEVAHVPGVTVVGPLPPAVQLTIVYGGAVARAAAAPDAAASFVAYLADSARRPAWREAGFRPPGEP